MSDGTNIINGWSFSEWKFDYEYTNNKTNDKVFRYLCVVEKENKRHNEDALASVLVVYLMNPSYACKDHWNDEIPIVSDNTVNRILEKIDAKQLPYNKVVVLNSCPFVTSKSTNLTKNVLNHTNVIKNYETIIDYIFPLEESFNLFVGTGNAALEDESTLTYMFYIKTMNAFENNKLRKQTIVAGINSSLYTTHPCIVHNNEIFKIEVNWSIKDKKFIKIKTLSA